MNREDESGVPVHPREQFDEKVPAHRKMLVGYVGGRTRNSDLAEDIAQETITKYLEIREADKWQIVIENEEAYLKKIARNLLTDGWRTQSKTKLVSLDQPDDDQGQKGSQPRAESFDVDKHIYLEELHQTIPLKTLLGRLSENQKRLLWLRVVEDMSYEEIAEKVNENQIIVRYELQRILATVRARVKKIYGDKKTLFKSDA